MQPEASNTPIGVERQHAEIPSSSDRMPVLPAPEAPPEMGIERGAERVEQAAEMRAVASDLSAPATPTPVPVATDSTTVTTPSVSGIQTPTVANDEDVIEKEWVDHAKKIIHDTKDDPHQRGEEVGKLQKDYLRKRYGKELGAPPQEAA